MNDDTLQLLKEGSGEVEAVDLSLEEVDEKQKIREPRGVYSDRKLREAAEIGSVALEQLSDMTKIDLSTLDSEEYASVINGLPKVYSALSSILRSQTNTIHRLNGLSEVSVSNDSGDSDIFDDETLDEEIFEMSPGDFQRETKRIEEKKKEK